jgi:hypothetical protein
VLMLPLTEVEHYPKALGPFAIDQVCHRMDQSY